MPDQHEQTQPDRVLDGRDLAMVLRQAHALEDRVMAQIDNLKQQQAITWEAYKREANIHATNHAHEHTRDNEARQIALGGMDKRLEGMNEFRAQLKEQAATFATKDQLDARIAPIDLRLQNIEKALVASQGKGTGASTTIQYIVMALGALVTISTLLVIFSR